MRFASRFAASCCLAFVSMLPTTALAGAAVGAGGWSRPVSGPVVRQFDPPETRFGPGHLGVDFAAPPATPVRAAADGIVVFAGKIGSERHVVVRHSGDIRTSYSFLASVDVVSGQAVQRGAVVGTSGGRGPRHEADVVHFGVRVGANYVDPMLLFEPVDLSAVVHLAAPRGGPAGPSRPEAHGPGALGERAVLVAALRVDARPAASAPAWWSAAHPATTEPDARDSPSVPAAASEGGPTPSTRGPVTAVVAATVVAVGGFTRARRRWSGRR